MMHYITKVGEYHIIELNGKNIQVRQRPDQAVFIVSHPYNSTTGIDQIQINDDSNFSVCCSAAKPFTAIVAAVELVKFIKEQRK